MAKSEPREGGGTGARAGTRALSLLGEPLNVAVLNALSDGPKVLLDLVRAAGSSPQTTMRARLRTLAELGVLDRRRQKAFPGTIYFELTESGRELCSTAAVMRTWLGEHPEERLELGAIAAKGAIKALVEAWSSGMIRALAARPLSLTELNRVIVDVSYPALERRLSALRLVGQIARVKCAGRGMPYAVTPWLRQAVAPLAAAACWEHRHLAGAAPITNRDVEAALLLVVPSLRLPAALSGGCRLAAEMPLGDKKRLAGVQVEVESGRIVSCNSRMGGGVTAWACGSVGDWMQAVVRCDQARLEVGGEQQIAEAIVHGLHETLLTVPVAGEQRQPVVYLDKY